MNLDRRNLFLDIRVYLATRSMTDCIALMNSCLSFIKHYGKSHRVERIYYMAGCCLAAHVAVGHESDLLLGQSPIYRPEVPEKRIVGRWLSGRSFFNNSAASA
ncbi:hypothetical protein KOI40_03080 [Aestuariicella sp. G3-2]|uniref:hypothetical protein n=1 Tax=Pseudomaricurvus albidus TaxID=2842452 RepID=UPI001C0DBA09|nr:hypothetical protein [Aestuariicella albida]MBU3068785.1 hypothetical protein [Aestuariicella albida]